MLDRTQSPTINAKDLPNSLEAVNDYFYEQGFTDGLPIIPPTPERVERMLAGMQLAASRTPSSAWCRPRWGLRRCAPLQRMR